jgi:hypothetical protein
MRLDHKQRAEPPPVLFTAMMATPQPLNIYGELALDVPLELCRAPPPLWVYFNKVEDRILH